MAETHIVTEVLVEPCTSKRLSAFFDDENKEILNVEFDNKEIFRLDYTNLVSWVDAIKKEKNSKNK